jgi:lysophospholipase L1-like esterase
LVEHTATDAAAPLAFVETKNMAISLNRAGRILRLWVCALALLAAPALPVWAQAPATTRVDVGTPATYTVTPGSSVAIRLNWYRVPMAANYLQFMHLVGSGGQTRSVDDHWTTSATWTAGVFSQTRTITVPSGLAAGTYDIRVGLSGGNPWVDLPLVMGAGVTDPGGDRRYKIGTITVSGAGNVAPQITSAPVTSASAGLAYGYRVTATDANGDTLRYSLTTRPTGMTINATSGQIAWTPTSAQTGSQAVTARVADPAGLATTQSFTINVAGANVAPQITSSPVTGATVGIAYGYRVTATDGNGDTLNYSLTQSPAGMTINAATGQIAWTPTSAQTGSQAVTARVADPGGLAATQAFTINVAGANVAPRITSTPVTAASVGAAYSYRVTATDANGDTLTYSLTQSPAGMTISPTTGQIAWTPTSAQTGSQAVTARVADPGGLAATQSFSVTVSAGSRSPQTGNAWRIMPIGDSNTENLAASPGYQVITQALTAIGSSSAVLGYVNPGEPNIVRQVTTPQIGRSGWSTTDVISQINGWVDQVIPDIVLLNIGVNDGYFPNDPAAQDAVVGRIGTIVDMIRARNPRTAILVSNFELASDPMPTMSTKIQQMVAQKATTSTGIFYNIFFLPSLTGVTSSGYTSDGIHPNESARVVIMNNWMNAVRSYVQTGTVPPPTPSPPTTTRVDMASPTTYYALPGARVNINLNWYRMPMSANLLQFMHLDRNGSIFASVDDHWTTSASWTPGSFSQTRTITAPTTLGTYDIRVGLSGGTPWVDFVLATGAGVTDETNSRRYRVGTLVVTTTPP